MRANGKLAVLRSVKFLDRATLDLLYKITIRSVIEYGMIIFYHNLTQCQKKRLSQVQYRAAKLVTGALHFTSQVKLEKDLSWESLERRANFLGLCVFHKIAIGETRPLIRKCMPAGQSKFVNTRSVRAFCEFKFVNMGFSNSFFPFFTKLYNTLDPEIQKMMNMVDFKERLKKDYKDKKNKHFSRGISKWSNSLHSQLRLNQSYLNAHGFAINLKDSDLCLCSRSETTSHFFLSCFLYQEERKVMFSSIARYLPRFESFSNMKKLDIILSGFNLQNPEPDPRNISVVFVVQKFILSTKRFLPPTPAPPTPPPIIPIMP